MIYHQVVYHCSPDNGMMSETVDVVAMMLIEYNYDAFQEQLLFTGIHLNQYSGSTSHPTQRPLFQ